MVTGLLKSRFHFRGKQGSQCAWYLCTSDDQRVNPLSVVEYPIQLILLIPNENFDDPRS